MTRHATPLRYPGGKQRLAPFINEILEANEAIGWNYVEPYAGGAGVAMELLLRNSVGHVYLNDSSRHVYAFWRSMLKDPESFCSKVSRAALTVESWKRHREVVRHPDEHCLDELGFSTFFLNRCNRSGVLTAGVIGGVEQAGEWRVDARFPRRELIKRIEAIATRRSRISVANEDAEHFMVRMSGSLPKQSLVYCDPPYYEKAERLYLNSYNEADHASVAKTIQRKLKLPWIVSYDAHPRILDLYGNRRHFTYSLSYSAIRPYLGCEVFAFSDKLKLPQKASLKYVDRGLQLLRRSA